MSTPGGIELDDKRVLAPCLVCRSCVGPTYRIPTEQQYAVMDEVIQISNFINSIQQTEPHLRLLCTECAKMCDKHVRSLASAADGGQQAPAEPSTSGSAMQAFAIAGRSDPPLAQFSTLLSPPAELLAHPSDVEMLADYEPDADGLERYGVPLEPLVGTEVLLSSEPGEQPLPAPQYPCEMQSHSHSTERATDQRAEMEDRVPAAPRAEQQVANSHNQLGRTARGMLRELLMSRQLQREQEDASTLPAVGAAPERAGASASVGPPPERSRPAVQQQPLDYSTRDQQLRQHRPPGGNRGTEPGTGASASAGASQEGTRSAGQQEPLDYCIRNQPLQQHQPPVGASQEGTLSAGLQEPVDYSSRGQQHQQQRQVQQHQLSNGNVAAAESSAWLTAWREALCRNPAVLQAMVYYCYRQAQFQTQQHFGGSLIAAQVQPAAGAEIPPGNLVNGGTTQQLRRPQESRGDNLAALDLVAGNRRSAGASQQPQQHATSSIVDAAPGNSANRTADVARGEPPLELLQQLQHQQNLGTDNPAAAAEQPAVAINLSRRPRGRRPTADAPPVRRNSTNSGNQRSSCAHQADADRYTDAQGPLLEPFRCGPCNVTYVNFRAFRQHMFDSHGLLECPLCRRQVNVFVYETHVLQCYTQAVYCTICRSWYHRTGVSGPRPVAAEPGDSRPPTPPGKQVCQFCRRYFSKYYLLRHIRAKHPYALE